MVGQAEGGVPGRPCFVVLTHTQPGQAGRLLSRLRPFPVLVHVDSGAPRLVAEGIAQLAEAEPDRVELLRRYRSGWASWGQVEATLNGIRQALDRGCSRVVVLTGQDYPLWPASELDAYLAARGGDVSWVRHAAIPVPWLGESDGGRSRITRWHLPVRGRRIQVPMRRKVPPGLTPHYGQAQCCLSAPLARWMLAELDRRPEVGRFFRRAGAPDELLIPTMAMASPMAADVSDDNLWYTDWSEGGPHPKTLGTEDYEALRYAAREGGDQGGWGPVKLFARKFDQRHSSAVLDCIDEELLGVRAPGVQATTGPSDDPSTER